MKVLYATDGGAPALQALTLLERVAAPAKTEVTVVTVGETEGSTVGEVSLSADILAPAAERLRQAGFTADQRLLSGNPTEAILQEITSGGFELTVVGAGNHSRLGRFLMGSVSTKLLHASPASLMVVHRFSDVRTPIQVLFATDGSRHARLALDQLIGFAEPSSCEIEVLSIVEHLIPVIQFPIPRVAIASSAHTPEQEKEWLAPAMKFVMNGATRLQAAGFKSFAQAKLGARIPRLLDEVDDIQADLVVVGTAGLGAVERTLLGSVSDQMVRHTPGTLVARGSSLSSDD